MISAIALDDEIPALEVLEALSSRNNTIDLKAVFSKTNDALRYLQKHEIDLLFLDINMPAMSGLDFAKAIDNNIIIIFTTSYSEYAVEGFNLNAIDYLLKPFSYQRFIQAVNKAKNLYDSRITPKVEPLFFRANYGIMKIYPNEILFIEGLDNYLKIHLVNGKKQVLRITLKEILEKLPEDQFLRVHKSYIIAITAVDFIRNKTIFIGNDEIPLSKTFEISFFKVFNPKG